MVSRLLPGGAADRGGQITVGDVIESVNGVRTVGATQVAGEGWLGEAAERDECQTGRRMTRRGDSGR